MRSNLRARVRGVALPCGLSIVAGAAKPAPTATFIGHSATTRLVHFDAVPPLRDHTASWYKPITVIACARHR
jgi:hypothetical protein